MTRSTQTQNLKSAYPRLLSIGDDDCASPPCHSVSREIRKIRIPGRRYGYGYDPGKTLKLHLPEGYDMGATSTTDLEPLSDHGAPPRVRRIAAAHVAPLRASRHFSARQTREKYVYGFLNPVSHIFIVLKINFRFFMVLLAFSFVALHAVNSRSSG